MHLDKIPDYLSYFIAVLGLAGTFYYGIRSTRLQKRLTRFTWNEVEHGINLLCEKVLKEFRPDVVLTISVPGKIISSLMMIRSLHVAIEYSALTLRSKAHENDVLKDHFMVRTQKFTLAVPKAVAHLKDKKILVVDSAVVTGDLLLEVMTLLREKGVPVENLKSASLIVTDFAIQAGKAPDFYWSSVKDTGYSLPWGNLSVSWY
ncbi:MAG TPA: hypothetical protein VN224_07830 [Xanthomonadales bacterium]|nr:hypothetical protein [Xanthomonadales bacterium]